MKKLLGFCRATKSMTLVGTFFTILSGVSTTFAYDAQNPQLMRGKMPRCVSEKITNAILTNAAFGFDNQRKLKSIELGKRHEGLYVISRYGGGKVNPDEQETTFCTSEAVFHFTSSSKPRRGAVEFIVKWVEKSRDLYSVEVTKLSFY